MTSGLLTKYGSIENMLATGRFEAQVEELRLYRSIATMNKVGPSSIAEGAGADVGQGIRARTSVGDEPAG